ncbi:hypothetical protein YC2023_034761 [Brassica napus]
MWQTPPRMANGDGLRDYELFSPSSGRAYSVRKKAFALTTNKPHYGSKAQQNENPSSRMPHANSATLPDPTGPRTTSRPLNLPIIVPRRTFIERIEISSAAYYFIILASSNGEHQSILIEISSLTQTKPPHSDPSSSVIKRIEISSDHQAHKKREIKPEALEPPPPSLGTPRADYNDSRIAKPTKRLHRQRPHMPMTRS